MKVLTPYNHNMCLVEHLNYGDAFFWEKDLYIKVDTQAIRKNGEHNLWFCMKLKNGMLYSFGNIEVQYEPNAYISILEKE